MNLKLVVVLFLAFLACASLAQASSATSKEDEPVPLTFKVGEHENEAESRVFAWTFLMLVTVLIIALIQGYTISVMHCEFFSEAAGAIILGCLVGVTVKYIGGFERFTELVQFNQEFFFLVLLPPIIFESGYNMQKVRPFAFSYPPHFGLVHTPWTSTIRFCFSSRTFSLFSLI